MPGTTHDQPVHSQLACEAAAYNVKHPRRVPPAGASNYPALSELYSHAVTHHNRLSNHAHFVCAGEAYGIVWVGARMCVMHVRTARILVGAPGERND
jgi:hypothetical protein